MTFTTGRIPWFVIFVRRADRLTEVRHSVSRVWSDVVLLSIAAPNLLGPVDPSKAGDKSSRRKEEMVRRAFVAVAVTVVVGLWAEGLAYETLGSEQDRRKICEEAMCVLGEGKVDEAFQ